MGKKNKQKSQVIALPDGTAKEAAEVIAASEVAPGETSPLPDTPSSDLMQAATDPAAALSEEIPVNDTEQPKSEAEIVAAVIEAEAEEVPPEEMANGEHPINALFAERELPPEDAVANTMLDAVSDFGERIEHGLQEAGRKTKEFFFRAGLKLVRWKNDLKDAVIVANNKWSAFYHYQKENPQWLYQWWVYKKEAALSWAEQRQLAWKQHKENSGLRGLSTTVLDLEARISKEMKSVHSRMECMEKALRKQARAYNRSRQADPDQLVEFAAALTQGRKAKAADLFRALTGSSLAEATEALNGVSA